MEWVRTCFDGHWRLFAGAPLIKTKGRYVRCPPGAYHYPNLHNLGSRDWTSDERDPWPALGETEDARTYYGGNPPSPYPRFHYIGSINDIRFGTGPVTPNPIDWINGYPPDCWDTPPLGLPVIPPVLSIFSRPTATQLAIISDLLYDNPAVAVIALEQLLGPGAVVSVVPNDAGVVPGTLIGISPTQTVLVISGTTNEQQMALQWLNAVGGITDYGQFSTLTTWYDSAQAVAVRMTTAGVTLNRPLTIVGHSYGGAVGQVLSAILKIPNPSADIRLITYGMPRPGDDRLWRLLFGVPQINFAAIGDPVPSLPPTGRELFPLVGITPAALYFRWNEVYPPRNPYLLYADGRAVPGDVSPLDGQLVFAAVQSAIAGTPQPDYPAHSIKEYVLRLAMSPP